MNKADFEIRALCAGCNQKDILDFENAFKNVTGYPMDSVLIDSAFLKENGSSTSCACKALMVAKNSMENINRIAEVFESFFSQMA